MEDLAPVPVLCRKEEFLTTKAQYTSITYIYLAKRHLSVGIGLRLLPTLARVNTHHTLRTSLRSECCRKASVAERNTLRVYAVVTLLRRLTTYFATPYDILYHTSLMKEIIYAFCAAGVQAVYGFQLL